MSNTFYQDFLFENIKTDENEFPLIEIKHSDLLPYCEEYKPDFQKGLFDSFSIKFTQLIDMTKEEDWNNLLARTSKYNTVYLIDDISLENEELREYKDFYLKTYFYKLKEACPNCFVVANA